MKSIFDNLTKKEKDILAHFYGTEQHAVLKKLFEAERLNVATKLVDVPANDVVTIARLQGQAENCKQFYLGIKKFYKEYNNNKN